MACIGARRQNITSKGMAIAVDCEEEHVSRASIASRQCTIKGSRRGVRCMSDKSTSCGVPMNVGGDYNVVLLLPCIVAIDIDTGYGGM